ncbi:MAG: enolase [Patescibacteria group bacterium]|nr:MAG: enolase [Patescibacteria group bacterium]
MKIERVSAIEVLDSRGWPTVRAFVFLEDGSVHSASVPSGASTGTHEAMELRDGDASRYKGKGVLKAVENINTTINSALTGKSVLDVEHIDETLCELDGTANKSHLGGNATLAVSEAALRAAAHAHRHPLWKFLHQTYFADHELQFPRLMVNVINGGKHANWGFDLQEFMLLSVSNEPAASIQVCAEIFHALGSRIKKMGLSTLVGDEGGYSPLLSSNEQAFELIIEAAKDCGYANGKEYELATDVAASEFYEDGKYVLKKDNRSVSPDELREYYLELQAKYQIRSFEDPFFEDDWEQFMKMRAETGRGFQLVGDDLTVTNAKRVSMAIEKKAANAMIVKPNQIGTILETVAAMRTARADGWKLAVSHRSGETEDAFIADLAYAAGADFIKTGSMSRSDRLAKYNRMLEIQTEVSGS